MQVSVRRVHSIAEFRRTIRSVGEPVIPLWREEFSALASDLVSPEDDFQIHLPAPFVSEPFRHPVIGDANGVRSRFAARYAQILGRPFLTLDQLQNLDGFSPASVTCFPPLRAGYGWVRALRTFLHERHSRPVPLGILTAESLSVLTWVAVKQILQRVTPTGAITWVDNFADWVPPLTTGSSFGAGGSAEQLREAVIGAGTVLLHSHSRPYCGVMFAPETRIGVCASPTLGSDRMCFGGNPCFFAGQPIIALEKLNASRLLFNGCYTARLGDDACGLPASAAHVFAALRGRVAEFVGNVRAGRYTSSDVLWFIALSSLRYPPAAAVEVIEAQRKAEHREYEPSLIYVGDASNPAWTLAIPKAPEMFGDSDRVCLRWWSEEGVVAARLPDGDWNRLARDGRLSARVEGGGEGGLRVSVTQDPWDGRSLILVALESPADAGTPLCLELRRLPGPLNEVVGSKLQQALGHLEFLGRIPVLHEALGRSTCVLREKLAALCQIATDRENLADREARLSVLRQMDHQLAHVCDEQVVRGACQAASRYWDWQSEYAAYAIFTPGSDLVTCPYCGAPATEYIVIDRLNSALRRKQTVCLVCAIVSDLPDWELTLAIDRGDVSTSPERLMCQVQVHNHGAMPRRVALAVQVHGCAVHREDNADSVALIEIKPGERLRHAVTLVPDEGVFSAFTWVRTYVASRGEFGYFGIPVFFQSARDVCSPHRVQASAAAPKIA